MPRSHVVVVASLFLLFTGCTKSKFSFSETTTPPLLMAGQMNARAHSMVITVTVANVGSGDLLFVKSGTLVLPSGKRLYLLDHQKLKTGGGSNSLALPPRTKTKVRFDVLSDEVDLTEITEAIIEWPEMLTGATKGETTGGYDGRTLTDYQGTKFTPPPTVIRRE